MKGIREQCREKDNSAKAENSSYSFFLFSTAFRLGHLLARRKDGVIPTVVLVLSIDQVPGLEGVGSVWQCMESRWSQDTGDKPGFGQLSLCWFVRLQD